MSIHFENANLTLNPGAVYDLDVGQVKKLGVGTNLSDAVGTNVIDMKIGVEPATQLVDQIAIGAKDSSVGTDDATLALQLEADPVVIGAFTATHKIPVWINGVEYHISLDAV